MLEVSCEKSLGSFALKSSFTAQKGVLGILGASGCGKSMTLKCISGLSRPDRGSITLNGKVLFDSALKTNIPSRRRNIGYVFQNYALFPHLTVCQNIAYGIKNLDKRLRYQKATEMTRRMQLTGLEHHYPSQLSGGQQQRVALARTLIKDPELLLLDEPFSALDSHIKHLLEKELITIIKNNFDGIVLLVTHNVEEAYRICDHIMIMDKGENLQIGTKEEIIYTPSHITSARLTGCKNFLDVTVLEAKDNHYILKSNDLIFKAVKTNQQPSKNMIAGIRAHHLSLSSVDTEKANSFECDILEKIEGVFSTTVILNCKGCILQAEISKASCPHIADGNNRKLMLHIPPKRVFLMPKP
ncbi:MAG: Molybdenum transporter ATP-binding protein [Clostridia bacterium]|jgi:molybdate transport system ATP-binding protein|nr:Molybdenum transporter ATP-binding protein [Clostridia bacterium]